MSSYQITPHSFRQAKKLGVTIKPSTDKSKKIDVFDKTGKKLVSVGAVGYKDYGTYLKLDGKKKADERRRLYRIRHAKDNNKSKFPRGYYAFNILW